jgi:hypothetical protein
MAYDLSQSPTGGVRFIEEASSAVASPVLALAWAVNRAPTNTAIVGTLPANARIIDIIITSPVVSNAGTTATVSVGLSGGSATAFSAAVDVKTAIINTKATILAAWAPSATKQDITCTYTETGTASTAGTHNVTVLYTAL